MSDFSNPLYRKQLAEQAVKQSQKMREFTVGSPDDDQLNYMPPDQFVAPPPQHFQQSQQLSPAEAEQLRAQRQQQLRGIGDVPEAARKRIDMLIGIGRLTRDVNMDGHTFSLRTIKEKEAKEAMIYAVTNANTNAEVAFELKRQLLARSLFQIDGAEIGIVLGSDSLEVKLNVLDQFEEIAVEKLYSEFNSLREEMKNKYGLNTDAQLKEVSEDIKK